MTNGLCAVVVGARPAVRAVAAARAATIAVSERAALVIEAGPSADRGLHVDAGTGPARALRRRLQARGVAARACGRLVWCALPDPDAGEVLRAASCGPAVLALHGPREPWVEPLLEQVGVVLVAGAGGEVAALALAELRRRGVAAQPADAPGWPALALAHAGLPVGSAGGAGEPIEESA